MNNIFTNNKIRKILKLAYNHRLLLASFIFFFLFSAVVNIVFATPLYQAGETLNPTCAPGTTDCTVQILPSLTSGSVVFSDGINLDEDNANFFYDSSTHRLGLGTDTPATVLDVVGSVHASAGFLDNTNDGTYYSFTSSNTTQDPLNILYAANNNGIFTIQRSGDTTTITETGSGIRLVSNYVRIPILNTNEIKSGPNGVGAIDIVEQIGNTYTYVGLGATLPSAKLHIVDTHGEQLRVAYNSTNYLSTTVSSIGGVTNTITSSSGLPVFTFNKDLLVNGITVGKGGGQIATNTVFGNSAGSLNSSGNQNVFVGSSAGAANTTEGFNTYIGADAGSGATGSTNTFVGGATGHVTTGDNNAFFGYAAGYQNTSGDGNMFMGLYAGYENTDGGSNVAIGQQALSSKVHGDSNVAIGGSAMRYGIGTLVYNTAIGANSGADIDDGGEYNTAIGSNSAFDAGGGVGLSTGDYNTIIGADTGWGITTGGKNTIIGAKVQGLSTSLSNNIIIADGDGNQRINVNSSGNLGVNQTNPVNAKLESVATTIDPAILGTGLPGTASAIGVKGTAYQYGVYGSGDNGVYGIGNVGVYGLSLAASKVGVQGVGLNRGSEIGVYGLNGKFSGLFENTSAYESGGAALKAYVSYGSYTGPAFIAQNDGTGDLMQLFQSSNQYFTVDNGGEVGIGDTTPDYKLDIETATASTYTASFFNDGNNDNRWGIVIQAGADTPSANKWIQFDDGDGTDQGSICYTGGQANICAPSDERLKNNINDTSLGLDSLLAIKVRDFSYNSDPDDRIIHGFVAQELYDAYPDAVSKPTDPNEYWKVSYGQLTPLIVKSIQDLNLKIEGLATLDLSNPNSVGSLIKTFLADAGNTIEHLYAKIIHSDRIETKELCVGATCVTESQFLQMVNQAGIVPPPVPEPTPAPVLEETPPTNSIPDPNSVTPSPSDLVPPPDTLPDSGPVIEQIPSGE